MRYGHTELRNYGVSEEQGCRHTLGILFEYAWSMARVWLEAGKSMARVWLRQLKVESLKLKVSLYSSRDKMSIERVGGIQGEFTQNSKGIQAEFDRNSGRIPVDGSEMVRRWLGDNILVPRWDQNSPILGLKQSHTGTKTMKGSASQYDGFGLRSFRYAACLILLMVVGVGEMWGQDDLSGVYFIGSRDYNVNNTTTNYYLCPTENWYYYQTASPYYTDTPINANDPMPFMTTYQCRNGELYTEKNAVWVIEKAPAPNSSYYYIKRAIDGQFLTYNGAMGNNSDKGRMRVHLQKTADGDNALFQITYISNKGSYDIITKNAGPDNNNRKYMNISGAKGGGNGNQLSLQATNVRTDGPKINGTAINVGGTVGLWTSGSAGDNNSMWYLERTLLDAPTFSSVDPTSSRVTVNVNDVLPEGCTIRYTVSTNGSEPEDPTATSATMPADGYYVEETCIIKVAVELNGVLVTQVATATLDPSFINVHVLTTNCDNTVTLSSNVHSAHIRYNITTDNTDPANPTTSTGTLYDGYPLTLNIGDKLKAIAYTATLTSEVTTYTHAKVYTDAPTITYTSSAITITGDGTIYYTTNGTDPEIGGSGVYSDSSPIEIAYNGTDEVEIRAIAKSSTLKASCVTHLVTLTSPTVVMSNDNCNETSPQTNVLTITGTDDGRTFWYAITPSNDDAGHTASAAPDPTATPNPYQQYTLGTPVSINDIADGNTTHYTVHAYAMDAAGDRSSIVSSSWEMKTAGKPTLTDPVGSSPLLGISGGAEGDNAIVRWLDDKGTVETTDDISGSKTLTLDAHGEGQININSEGAVGTLTVTFQHGSWLESCGAEYEAPGAPATPTWSQDAYNHLSLDCATDMAVIHYTYTTDGTEPAVPTIESATYAPGCFDDIIANIKNTSNVLKVRAIAVKGFRQSEVMQTYTYNPENPEAPTFFVDGSTVTISTTTNGATVYYEVNFTTDGTIPDAPDNPTTSSTQVSGDYDLSGNKIAVFKAYAVKDGHASYIVTATTRYGFSIKQASDLSKLSTNPSSYFFITEDIDATGFTGTVDNFTGVIEGNQHTISNLTVPLIKTATNAVIHDLILKDVDINSTSSNPLGDNEGNIGALVCTANGTGSSGNNQMRIYNCGILGTITVTRDETTGAVTARSNTSAVSGTGKVGGLVGVIDENAHVINCFSYADINGGTHRGGIVGYNNVANSTSGNLQTMVMNCMFYGNINTENSPTQIAPIYGGNIIHNKRASDNNTGLNNYCYFLYDEDVCPYVTHINPFNGALGAEERFLNRFELFRLTLNSTRDMAAFYVSGTVATKDEIAKWVLDKKIAPYPILKAPKDQNGMTIKYPSIINPDADHAVAIDADNVHRNEGRKLGSLTVKIQMGDGEQFDHPIGASIRNANAQGVATITRNITDKDTANFNFNYKKIQLPYYNEVGTGNYTKASDTDLTGRVVTGWKITSITTSATSDPYTSDNYDYTKAYSTQNRTYFDFPNFNFVDRKSSNKDLYSVSGRIFNQGAYWEVPDGVTEITIEPYWAKCVFLSDVNYDVTYINANKYGVTIAGNCPTTVNNDQDLSVSNVLSDAITALGSNSSHTVYDYAVVLVGNYHNYTTNAPSNDDNPVTIMSADFDSDCEPDYTLFYYHDSRRRVSPIRFDFLNMPGIGTVKRTHDATTNPQPGIFKPRGWFEVTNTVIVRFGQFEYAENNNDASWAKTALAPLILQGGVYEQFVSAQNSDSYNTNYLLIGGNAWFKNFANGCHTRAFKKTPKVPVNVTGGDYENFYLSGIYQPNGTPDTENAECYVDGGRFDEMAGAGMQKINGDVTWLINGADIKHFYGGGINDAQSVTGNITTTISNSYVGEFYGGPKFGNMSANKTVTTTATDCHFNLFYGAGYGGTAFNKVIPAPATQYDTSSENNTRSWGTWITDQYKREYNATNKGVSTSYDYEFMMHSDGNQTVGRFYVNYASLSLASTRTVNSQLSGCKIGTFYGGGRLGSVNGDAISTLTDCTVTGDVFGAGYSASTPTVEVWPIENMDPAPKYNRSANVFNNANVKTPEDLGHAVTYTWSDDATLFDLSTDAGYLKDIPAVFENEVEITPAKHYIFTGYDENNQIKKLTGLGKVNGTASLTINGKTKVGGNVYGGGAASDVTDATEVTINGGTFGTVDEKGLHGGNVYGGGKGAADTFTCEKAMVGTNNAGADENDPAYLLGNTSVTINNGTVNGNVYGGGEVGRVERNTMVTIGQESGTGKPVIEGSVFGGGAGVKTHGYSALVRGNPTVIVQGNAWVKQSVYGGGEIASVARYKVPRTEQEVNDAIAEGYTDAVIDMPYTLANNTSGNCSVTIRGNAVIGPNDLAMPAFTGHVFGGGKGILPQYYPGTITDGTYTYENTNDDTHRPKRMVNVNDINTWEWFATEPDYIQFIQTLALASKTDVTIGGNAFVKGSVYGGSENGIVQFNTHVTIEDDCQIGCGKNAEGKRHPSPVWADGYTPTEDLECDSWPFEEPHKPYDLYDYIDPTAENPVPKAASDGHTFYGNVFGGGSGYFPYKQDPEYETKNLENNTKSRKDLGYADGVWLETAGIVRGNTVVDITGGHILTSVYGGNEQTDVVGTTTINMVGGTVGVPRSVSLMKAHPVTCYVFGAGKGDPRINFNTWTNVASTQVNITGNARIYGSTFGGGEDGHVLGDAETNIGGNVTIGTTNYTNQDVLIGTTGTSAVDGNVFGGGRGFSMQALTAGVIGGDVRVNIRGGKMLGTVFGGGRLASVGTYFADVNNANYGKMQADVITPAVLYTATDATTYNTEHASDPGFVPVAEGDVKTPASVTASHGHITVNIYDGTIGATNSDGSLVTSEYTVGDVFGGSKGASDLRFGLSKNTTVNISGGTINGSVFGGGELANVEGNTDVTVSGGTIGDDKTKKGGDKIGNVYGGGKGNLTDPDAGLVKGNTKVTISETDATNKPTTIYHNIYGGGAYGSVGTITRDASGETYVPGRSNVLNMPTNWEREDEKDNTKINTGTAEVYIYGGTIGRDGDENGMVFGSSRGDVTVPAGATADTPFGTDVDPNDHMAWTYNTKVVIGGEGKNPIIKGSVYGSGENGHVFTNTLVEIHNGTIGHHEGDSYDATRGNVYGGGCGEDEYEVGTGTNKKRYFNPLAGIVLGNTKVTMDGGIVKHNIYGAGALGSVGSGTLGGKTTIEISGGTVGHDGEDNGNVFGAARGTDTDQAYIAHVRETEVTILPNATPAKTATIKGSVFGGGQLGSVTENVNVNILGGNILHDVYGGGALADTQTSNWDNETYTAVENPTRVTDLYTRSGSGTSQSPYVYTLTSHTTAASGTTYYRRGNWVNDKYHDATTTTPAYTTYNTHVNLLGGKISGDAYGGALGQLEYGTSGQAGYLKAIPAKVYGDVFVNLNGLETSHYDEDIHEDYVQDVSDHYVLKTTMSTGENPTTTYAKGAIVSRVFGANNLNGTPMGHVKVHVFATQNPNTDAIGGANSKVPLTFTETGDTDQEKLYYWLTAAGNAGVAETIIETAQAAYDKDKDDYTNTDEANAAYVTQIGILKNAIESNRYDVKAVYGGGNLAAYEPADPTPNTDLNDTQEETEVIIEGCDFTSIKQVYAGGNAAAAPATKVTVYECYEIDEVFGGGNGADDYPLQEGNDTKWYQNPGANVGYYKYAAHDKTGTATDLGEKTNPYPAIDDTRYDTKEERVAAAELHYGNGISKVYIKGGTIHYVYGGSNQRGNIRVDAISGYEQEGDCEMQIGQTYGAGKNAEIDGDISVTMACAHNVHEIFGGSKESDVSSNINLTITNGSSLDHVFGGNNISGRVNGSITVNIEEGGCEPIIIDELYSGGYFAPYSIYGYAYTAEKNDQGEVTYVIGEYDNTKTVEIPDNGGTRTVHEYKPREKAEFEWLTEQYNNLKAKSTRTEREESEYQTLDKELKGLPRQNPRINVISATRINNIYGGGYKATVVGNPHVNVNMTTGKVVLTQTNTGTEQNPVYVYKDAMEQEYTMADQDPNNPDNKVHISSISATTEDEKTIYSTSLPVGTIGTIYGGGNEADIIGDTYVEIGTGKWIASWDENGNPVWETENTTGKYTYKEINYTQAEIDEAANDESAPAYGKTIADKKWAWVNGSNVEAATNPLLTSRKEANITGNVFGGGQGLDDTFECEKAMVGVAGSGEGSTNVTIANGSVGGSVYGGGEIGRVEMNTTVTIGLEGDETNEPIIEGNVFGGGKGKRTHGYSALVRGNPTVIVQGNAKVRGNVYGGGEIASVGKYNIVQETDVDTEEHRQEFLANHPGINPDIEVGMPYSLVSDGLGICTVIVRGDAEIGPDNMKMAGTDTGWPTDKGHVFGAGEGVLPYAGITSPDKPKRMMRYNSKNYNNGQGSIWEYVPNTNNVYVWEYYDGANREDVYLTFIETLALATQTNVSIEGNAFVKGSVYGGSENGHVQHNTHVTIKDNCQIGNGHIQIKDNNGNITAERGVNRRYTAAEWAAGHLIVTDDPSTQDVNETDPDNDLVNLVTNNGEQVYFTASLPECASWPYESPYAPYDVYDYQTGTTKPKAASDGHTFYGNVFGGGSGYYPYRQYTETELNALRAKDPNYSDGVWHRAAGSVGGNSTVDILGGHILTSVYGGNEQTDVGTYAKDRAHDDALTIPVSGGLCTVNMVGGTLGVPRTLAEIAAHPVTCYLFGAGKGDQRINFNTWTNVINTQVNIGGNARIYGSTFGGGEDGHVIEDAETNIGGTVTIGTSNHAYSNVTIGTWGTSYVEGNVFGGGRGFGGDSQTAGNVGGNVRVNIYNGTMLGNIYGGGRLASVGTQFTAPDDPNYGNLLEDVADDPQTTTNEAKTYGHVTINISGGTIGNTNEDIVPSGDNTPTGLDFANIANWTAEQWDIWKAANNVPNTEFEFRKNDGLYHANHTKGGNVFGGSMGRLTLLNGDINPIWPKLAQVKDATVNIYGNATIKRSVFGGGELGTVRDNTYVTIGGTLGTNKVTVNKTNDDYPTVRRDVYGGGFGSKDHATSTKITVKEPKAGVANPTTAEDYDDVSYVFTPMIFAGCVGQNTYVNIVGGQVKKSVYGGGEMASVGIIDCRVEKDNTTLDPVYTDTNGDKYVFSHNHKHDNVNNDFILSWPNHFEYVPGFDGNTHVKVTGGRLGLYDDEPNLFSDDDNGDVVGGGKGMAGDYNNFVFLANVGSTEVTIEYPESNTVTFENYESNIPANPSNAVECITGAVYGGGENGHVMGDTKVTLKRGLVGHSIYGGGSGKGKFSQRLVMIGAVPTNPNEPDKTKWIYKDEDHYTRDIYSITAGKVFGNTEVEMTGGYVVRNVYGGGNMGSVGKGNYAGGIDDYSYYDTSEKTYCGYGEKLAGNLWDGDSERSQAFLNSGKAKVTITGGKIGYINPKYSLTDPEELKYNMYGNLPYGNVFGGCRGEAAPNITETPRYLYSPEFFVGYVNETEVTIGTSATGTPGTEGYVEESGPTIIGSVYGGGMDGHVRRDTHVTINGGEIGMAYTPANISKLGNLSITDEQTGKVSDNIQWLARGNVYGAGSGIGKYKYDFDYDGDFDSETEKDGNTTNTTYNGKPIKEEDYSASAGSVTRFTRVDINGGTIHRNVYGGGSQSSVGPPKIPPTRTDGDGENPRDIPTDLDNYHLGMQTQNQVNIASTIGTPDGYVVTPATDTEDAVTIDYNPIYGGEVYGASRGNAELGESFATSTWTEVNLLPGAHVQGNAFGGGDAGIVKHDSEVNVGVVLDATLTNSDAIAPAGDSKIITVKANAAWTAASSANWLTLSATSGTGNGTVTVTATANTTTDARTAFVTISIAGRTQVIRVMQAGVVLSATAASGNIPKAGGSKAITVTSNVAWTAASSANWLTLSATSGTGNGTVTVTADENTTASERQATITISDGDQQTQTITVTQAGS